VHVTTALRVSKEGQRRFYSRQLRTLHLVLIIVMAFAMTLGAANEWANGDVGAYRRISRIFIAIAVTTYWRTLQRGISVDPERVVIRNLLWSRRVPTSEVESFGSGAAYGRALFRTGMPIYLVSGKRRFANVFTSTPADAGERRGSPEASELNKWLADIRAGTRYPAGSVVPQWRAYGAGWGWRLWVLLVLGLTGFAVYMFAAVLLDPASFASLD
jgi:hypothetical protein